MAGDLPQTPEGVEARLLGDIYEFLLANIRLNRARRLAQAAGSNSVGANVPQHDSGSSDMEAARERQLA